MAEYESTLAVLRECYVYRIPPRSTSKGYKAADWDVEKHIWAGRLRITARGEQAFIKLEDPNTGNFFFFDFVLVFFFLMFMHLFMFDCISFGFLI